MVTCLPRNDRQLMRAASRWPVRRGQHRQQRRDVEFVAVSVDDGVHREAVAQVVNARVGDVGAQPDQTGDHAEDVFGLPAPQHAPGDRHEESIDARCGAEPVPCRGVGAERSGDRWVHRHQPYPVELSVPDRDQALDEIDVGPGQRERFPEAHAGRGQQPEQRPVGGRPQRWL